MPLLSSERFASEDDRRANAEAIRCGSRSFHAASLLLPAYAREPAFGLYAFCRLSDDCIDESGDADALASLHVRLEAVYAGRPHDHPADRAFADVVRRHHIPREIPLALLEGFAWDCEGRTYADLNALHAYAARVAGTVGAMMTLLMGVSDGVALARACDLGVAMQLTNIARDVGEDARAGRLYLPLDWLAEAGVDAQAFLDDPAPSPALARVVLRLLNEADRLYARARDGVARLPPRCRPAILAAAAIYAEIGREVKRRGCDSVSSRARVSLGRKLGLLADATLAAAWLKPRPARPPLAATAFLVDAAARPQRRAPSFEERFVNVLAIFERLERGQQLSR